MSDIDAGGPIRLKTLYFRPTHALEACLWLFVESNFDPKKWLLKVNSGFQQVWVSKWAQNHRQNEPRGHGLRFKLVQDISEVCNMNVFKGFYRKAFSIWVLNFENYDPLYSVGPHFSPKALFSPLSLLSSTTFGVIRWSKNRFFKIVLELLLDVRYWCWGPN